MASPILPTGELISIPIPESKSHKQRRRYSELRYREHGFDKILAQLSSSAAIARGFVHLDPDIRQDVVDRGSKWCPAFGQAGPAQGHLRRQRVSEGDLFLFFGWFREVTNAWETSKWEYVKAARGQHVLFGWLQIGLCINVAAGEKNTCAADHPHMLGRPYDTSNDMVYVASSELAFPGAPPGLPGAGVFTRVTPTRILTAIGECRSQWQLPASFVNAEGRVRLSYHAKRSVTGVDSDRVCFRAAGRGQEFVVQCTASDGLYSWLAAVFEDAV